MQSNGDIMVANSANLTAAIVQSSGTSSGNITPTPQTGAPAIPDPFSTMRISPPLPLCPPVNVVYDVGVNVILPGTHCGAITVRDGATVYLMRGEHYFTKGGLQMKNNSTLSGTDVVLVFDDQSRFQF